MTLYLLKLSASAFKSPGIDFIGKNAGMWLPTLFYFTLMWLNPVSLHSQKLDSESSTKVIAVLAFTNNTNSFANDRLGFTISEILKTELSHHKQIVVVEREHIEKIMEEQTLSLSGVIEVLPEQQVGRLIGAEYILKGEISLINSDKLRIDCHIIKVKTGQVKGEKVVGSRDQSIEKMVQLLAGNIYYNLTGSGAYQTSARLKKYPMRWFLLATTLSAITSGITHFISENAYDSYQESTRLDEFDRHINRANKFRDVRNGFITATAVLAITTTILWLKERGDDNKMYAQTYPGTVPATLWAVNFNLEAVRLNFAINF